MRLRPDEVRAGLHRGEPLPLKQEELRIHGHAIEARICAENPDNNFLPATGALNVYALPECVTFERGAVRVDSGVRQGDAISPFYDSMVAKLIAHGRDRSDAIRRLMDRLLTRAGYQVTALPDPRERARAFGTALESAARRDDLIASAGEVAAFVQALLAVIREAGMLPRVMIQSFDWRTLQLVQRIEQ